MLHTLKIISHFLIYQLKTLPIQQRSRANGIVPLQRCSYISQDAPRVNLTGALVLLSVPRGSSSL